jgi:tyrosine-protein kinase Etk/Wzc
MNNTASTDPRNAGPDRGPDSMSIDRDKPDDFNLGEMIGNIWEGRWLIFGSIMFFIAAGLFYVYSVAPVYRAVALLQTEMPKRYAAQSNTDFTKMEGVYSLPTIAQGEIEILKSNLVLGGVVDNLRLDLSAGPIVSPFLGQLALRNAATRPLIVVDQFDVPDVLRKLPFKVIALAGNAFALKGPDGTTIGTGNLGEKLTADYKGDPVSIRVRRMRGKVGQQFALSLNPKLDAINSLRMSLQVEERGKNSYESSNILQLSLSAPDPVQGAQVLNEILNQYLRQAIQRKMGDSSQALKLLEAQRPALQAQVAEAESRLNGYRRQAGALDVPREGEIYLQQGASLDAQITALQQKKQDLLRTFTEKADVVVTLDAQIAKLQAETRRNEQKVSDLPRTQQEVVRLTRDAQVKSDMYTSLLNSIQQLQNTLAGSVGNARVVDYAIPPQDPVEPRKTVLMILFLFLGTVAGVGLTILRRVLHKGIEDHRVIESKMGWPILVTVPHSLAQKNHSRAISKRIQGYHLLAVSDPEDLATESFRSLRTALHFAMTGATNRTVMITGPAPQIGKSFVSANLAVVLAQGGARVLLVDADLRKGGLHHLFGISRRVGGLSEVLSGNAEWQSVCRQTDVPDLSLISTGILPPDPLVLLMSGAFDEFVAQVSEAFDFVVFDAAPVLAVSDALVIGSKVDSILMVAKYGKHPVDELRTCQKRMKSLEGKLRGCVFNDIKLVGMRAVYGYYKYDYRYKYGATDH